MAVAQTRPRILAIDAGGTMTDTILVNEKGEFVVGKAQSTPEDESVGFVNSLRDALHYWNVPLEEGVPHLVSGIYSGTAMLNRLLERKGLKLGLLVTAGFEDYLRIERGIQTYLGYSYSDRLHLVTHVHNTPWSLGIGFMAFVVGSTSLVRSRFPCTRTKFNKPSGNFYKRMWPEYASLFCTLM
ncbi:hydantoinase/oxoprolinase N-terminal domain-containing protein [Kyrpidia spormannii]|uniref:Hydantoinase/oxoprolinase N-terminal domain-containing protein n=1 Tax=Kyrpidia spormannii TaxID=2055160 RepID=A0A6F9EB51_9BACL|nr:protein of unknown function [Kyrpidia spormannii]